MQAYAVRRLILIVPTLILITILVFISARFIPGSVIDLMLSQVPPGSGITAESIRHSLGLDVPLPIAYLRWLGSAMHGDLGKSFWTGHSITEDILKRLPVSFELGLLAVIIAIVIAIPIGIYSAMRQDAWGDYVGRTIAIAAISVPSFWLGILLMVYPALWWGWSPAMEYIPFVKDPAGNLLQFLVPAAILGMVMSGTTMRMTRTMMLEVLRSDYIRTAWSKGLREWTVIARHALKNALMPVITIVGTMLPVLVGGSVVLEQIFVLPGIGRFLIDALNQRDYPVIVGIDLVLAVFVLMMNLLVDLTYGYLDPRVKYR